MRIARRIRAAAMPILMLTAADDIVDRVVGLEIGADDYLTKPFDLRELRARIAHSCAAPRRAAAAARAAAGRRAGETACARSLCGSAILLDLDARRLLRDDGTALPLTAMEFDLLRRLRRTPTAC